MKTLKPGSVNSSKYSHLAVAKKELADMQMELVDQEKCMKKEKHQKEMNLLELQIEGQRLKNILLQQKCNALANSGS